MSVRLLRINPSFGESFWRRADLHGSRAHCDERARLFV